MSLLWCCVGSYCWVLDAGPLPAHCPRSSSTAGQAVVAFFSIAHLKQKFKLMARDYTRCIDIRPNYPHYVMQFYKKTNSCSWASLFPSRSPARIASMIAMPLLPVMSDKTIGNWIFIKIIHFCILLTHWDAPSISRLRWRVYVRTSSYHSQLFFKAKELLVKSDLGLVNLTYGIARTHPASPICIFARSDSD